MSHPNDQVILNLSSRRVAASQFSKERLPSKVIPSNAQLQYSTFNAYYIAGYQSFWVHINDIKMVGLKTIHSG